MDNLIYNNKEFKGNRFNSNSNEPKLQILELLMGLLSHTPKIFNSLNSPSEIIYSNEMQQLKPLKLLHSNPAATTTFAISLHQNACMMRNLDLFIVLDYKCERHLKSTQTWGILIVSSRSFQKSFQTKKKFHVRINHATTTWWLHPSNTSTPPSEKWNNPCGLRKGVLFMENLMSRNVIPLD